MARLIGLALPNRDGARVGVEVVDLETDELAIPRTRLQRGLNDRPESRLALHHALACPGLGLAVAQDRHAVRVGKVIRGFDRFNGVVLPPDIVPENPLPGARYGLA